jgi:hypothetical protein
VVSYHIVVVRKGCQLLKIVQGIDNDSYYRFSSWFHFKLNLIFDPERLALYHSKLMTWQCSGEVHMLVKHIHSYLYNLDHWKALSPSYWIKPWYCWHIHSPFVASLRPHLGHLSVIVIFMPFYFVMCEKVIVNFNQLHKKCNHKKLSPVLKFILTRQPCVW